MSDKAHNLNKLLSAARSCNSCIKLSEIVGTLAGLVELIVVGKKRYTFQIPYDEYRSSVSGRIRGFHNLGESRVWLRYFLKKDLFHYNFKLPGEYLH